MSRLYIKSESQAQAVVDELYRSIENRIAASHLRGCVRWIWR